MGAVGSRDQESDIRVASFFFFMIESRLKGHGVAFIRNKMDGCTGGWFFLGGGSESLAGAIGSSGRQQVMAAHSYSFPLYLEHLFKY